MALGKNRQQQTTNYNNNYNNNNQQRQSYGLWVNTSKEGKEYLTFEINGVKYIAFENTKKTSERSPDYNIYKKDDLQSNQNNGYGYQGQKQNGNYQPNQYPQNNGYTQNQGSESTTYRNENVGASEPQNPGYDPDPLKGLSL
jgi:hypothetical protein